MRLALYGTLGAGPSHWSHSHSFGGGPSGAGPRPFGHSLRMWKQRATVTCPRPPERTNSAASRYVFHERRLVPTCTTRLVRSAASTILRPSKTVRLSGFSTYTSFPALHASTN